MKTKEEIEKIEKEVDKWFQKLIYRKEDTFRQVDSFDIEELKQTIKMTKNRKWNR